MPDIGDYIIVGVMVLFLLSLVFVFYTVIPSVGFMIYQEATIYAWKPMSWMPLWGGIAIFIFMFFTIDHFKPIVYFGNQKKWYRSWYETNGAVHFRLFKTWKGELIVLGARVAGRDKRKYVVSRELEITRNGKDMLVEGSELHEVSEITAMEKRIAMKDEQIATLQRQNEALTGRMFYFEKEMEKIRSGSGRKNE